MEKVLGKTYRQELLSLPVSSDGSIHAGENGIEAIYTPADRKVEFFLTKESIYCSVKSAMGYPAIYPLRASIYNPPAKAVLMDLDGTSVHSENFWIWIIEQTTASLLGNPRFSLEELDLPFVSGHSVSEHLQYCLNKYCPDRSIEEARKRYFAITRREMQAIMEGHGKADAFTPVPYLKEFLLELKSHGVKIGLVTSGLTEKALPEILSAFRTLWMGDPLEFYDAVISAGTALSKGQVGTLGELEPKPHPWLYAETARVGLGYTYEDGCVIVLEDSSAGVVSARLAGFPCIGMEGGNIRRSGVTCLCHCMCGQLPDALSQILGR